MADAGTAYLNVVPSLSGFSTALDGALAPITSKFEALAKNKAALGLGAIAIGAGVAGKALYDLGADFDAAYDKIRISTGATGRELEGLKGDFREVVKAVPTDFATAGTAIGELNQRLGLTGKPLQDMAKQLLELSRITETDLSTNIESVSRAFVDWEVPVAKQSKMLDGFFRIAQESGASVGELTESVQKFGSPLRQLGFSLEEAGSMFAIFEKAGVNTQTMVPGLKLAISNLTRPTEDLGVAMAELGIPEGDPEKGLRRIFELLSSGSNLSQIEKTGLAMDVFGKRAGADMAEAIKQGRFELDDMIKVFRDGDETILGTAKATNDLGENMTILGNKLKVALEPAATAVFNAINQLVVILANADLTSAFTDIRSAITPLVPVFQWFVNTTKLLVEGWVQTIKGALQIVRGVVLVFSGLFKGDFSQMWEGIKLIFSGALNLLVGQLKMITAPLRAAAAPLGDAIKAGFNAVGSIPGAVGHWIGSVGSKLAEFGASLGSKAGQLGSAIFQGVIGAVKSIPGSIASWLGNAAQTVLNFVGSFAAKAAAAGDALADGIVKKIKSIPGAVAGAFAGVAVNIGTAIRDWINANTLFGDHIHINLPGPRDIDFDIPALAGGTSNFAGGLAKVGEEGEELVYLPRGAAVADAQRTRALMSGGSRSRRLSESQDGGGPGKVFNVERIETLGSGMPDPGYFVSRMDALLRASG